MSNSQYPDAKEMRRRRTSEEPTRKRRKVSAAIQRLARRLGRDPDELAAQIPADTLRRTRFPVLEEVDEVGKRTFKHDPQIVEGRIALR